MPIINTNIICDEDQNFSCSNCEDICCKSFSIKIDENTKHSLESLEIVNKLIKESNENFETLKDSNFYLPVVKENSCYRCLFNSDTEHCLIHKNYGYNFKPPSCQLFPFSMYFDNKSNIHIETSFSCKSILQNYGSKLVDIKHSITEKFINLEFYPEFYPLYNGSLKQDELFILSDNLKSIINDSSLTLDESIIKYITIIKTFSKNYNSTNSFEKAFEKTNIKSINFDFSFEKDIQSNLIFCIYLTNLLLYSTFSRKNPIFKDSIGLIKKYISVYTKLISQRKKSSLPFSDKIIDLNELSKIEFETDKTSDSLIRRYLTVNILRFKYLNLENIDLQFLYRPVIYYCLIKTYSKILAKIDNKNNVTQENIEDSISIIELVFYHSNIPMLPSKSANNLLCSILNSFYQKEHSFKHLVMRGF